MTYDRNALAVIPKNSNSSLARSGILSQLFSRWRSNAAEEQTVRYFPPNTDRWRYEYAAEFRSPGGSILRYKIVARVDGHKLIRGKVYYREIVDVLGLSSRPETTLSYTRQDEKGCYSINREGEPEHLDTPFPIAIGRPWASRSRGFLPTGFETVQINDQIYANCLRIEILYAPDEPGGIWYMAPQVGLVKAIDRGLTLKLQRYQR